MTQEAEIVSALAAREGSRVDFEILTDILVRSCGWQGVELGRFPDNKTVVDILEWCRANCQHGWERHGARFVFKDRGDAVNFALRWSQ